MVDLIHNVPVKATAAKVFAAIATTEGNRSWWTADSRLDAKAGGKAEFGFDRREAVFEMAIDKRTPGKELVMSCTGGPGEWVGTTLKWRIEPQDGGCLLHFTHADWREPTGFCASCNSMWGNLMFRLKTYAETGKANPQWTE